MQSAMLRDPERSEGNPRIGLLRLRPDRSEGQDLTYAFQTLVRHWPDSG
jgi:hypothetical protein